MKYPKKSTMLAAASIAIGLGLSGAGLIHAQTTTTSSNPMSNLVSAIAQKFNLNQSDVQQVFDDQHAQMEAQHQQMFKDHIAQLVTDGKLTQEQADKIVAKQAELQTQREANRAAMEGKTETERHAAMDAERTALQKWATDNNIPMEYLRFGIGKGPKGHGGPGRAFGGQFDQPVSNNQTSN